MGQITKSDCKAAIDLLPHDPPMRPVLRNFYANPMHVNLSMSNQKLPLEETYGDCTVQILLASNFNNVPHDQTSWINLIGPARILMRECVDEEGTGGVLVRNGNHGNIEVTLYNRDSIYGKVHILRHSTDPVAVTIAEQELLELLNLVPNIYSSDS